MTRTEESPGEFVSRARMSSADARLPSAKTAFMISRSRRVSPPRSRDMCRILYATIVACQTGNTAGRARAASVGHRVEDDVDAEGIARTGELVEILSAVAFALEGVPEVGVVRHDHQKMPRAVHDASDVRLGAERPTLGGSATRAVPESDRRDLNFGLNVVQRVKDRMLEWQIEQRVFARGERLSQLVRPVLERIVAPKITRPEKSAPPEVRPQACGF